MIIPPSRSSSTRDEGARRSSSATGVAASLSCERAAHRLGFRCAECGDDDEAGVGEDRKRQRQAPRRRFRRVVDGDDGVRVRARDAALSQCTGRAGNIDATWPSSPTPTSARSSERRIAGNRLQLVGRAPRGLLEVGQLAVHAVDARRRARAPARATASMRARSSSRDGRAEPRARRSRTPRCASSRPRARRASGKNADATDPPGSATMNFSRLAITSAACVSNSFANAR